MELSGLVESPVLGDSQGGVAGPLLYRVPPAGAPGGYLHDEVGGLALDGYDIPVAVPVGLRVSFECYEQVRGHPLRSRGSRLTGDVPLAGDDSSLGVAQVLDEVVGAAAQGQVVEAGHILWLALRRVGEYEGQVAFPFGCV